MIIYQFLSFQSDFIAHNTMETEGSIMTGRSLCNP